MTNTIQNKIIIIGGGMNGLTLSLLLAQSGFDITCLDASTTDKQNDERTTAISYGSSQILRLARIWDEIKPHACPIKDIKIIDGKSSSLLNFGVDSFDHKKQYDAFGWIVENKFLFQILNERCAQQKNITHHQNQFVTNIDYQNSKAIVKTKDGQSYEGALVVGADGRQSFTRQVANIKTKTWQYNQKAVVCIVTHKKPHHNIAIEHFRNEGPFAILPMLDKSDGTHQSAVVWTIHKNRSTNIIEKKDVFLAALNERFPDSYGTVLTTSKPQIYPLNFNHAYDYIAPRTVLIGDAAHGIHPIAGQGLNIGLQDVATLNKVLIELKNEKKDIGLIENLKPYEQMRKVDNTSMAAATDLLNRLFSNNITPIKLFRKKSLRSIEKIHPIKKFFIDRAMGTNK